MIENQQMRNGREQKMESKPDRQSRQKLCCCFSVKEWQNECLQRWQTCWRNGGFQTFEQWLFSSLFFSFFCTNTTLTWLDLHSAEYGVK